MWLRNVFYFITFFRLIIMINSYFLKVLPAIALLMYSFFAFSVRAQEAPNSSYAEKGYLTFDTKPLGSIEKPLVLRTFVPTAGVSKQEVLANHSQGTNSPKYGASSGRNPKMSTFPLTVFLRPSL